MPTFYNQEGEPIAYTEDGEHIFLFSGEPVAFLKDESVFSYDGTHLGWYENGWVIDQNGYRVFFTKDATGGPMTPMTAMEPMKSMKSMKPMKSITEVPPVKPMTTNSWSDQSSAAFFDQ